MKTFSLYSCAHESLSAFICYALEEEDNVTNAFKVLQRGTRSWCGDCFVLCNQGCALCFLRLLICILKDNNYQ